VRTYIWSLAGVLSVGFLLLISLLLTAAISAAGKYIAPYLPEAMLQIAGFLASFAVIAFLFAMMFKWLPDTPIAWRDVWLGAILTAALFEVGKFLIGLYIEDCRARRSARFPPWRRREGRQSAAQQIVQAAANVVEAVNAAATQGTDPVRRPLASRSRGMANRCNHDGGCRVIMCVRATS
jgi:hypothetical protein